MKYVLAILFPLIPACVYGQFALISDKDGYVNVRQNANMGSNITDTLENNHLVYCFEQNGNWTTIDYTRKNQELSGYIAKDRYRPLSGFLSVPLIRKMQDSVILKRDSIIVIISRCPFEGEKHSLKYAIDNPDQLEWIDNESYWGTDGALPSMQFCAVIIMIGTKCFLLPQPALKGLYEPALESALVYFNKDRNTFYIQTGNSDGAGSYLVVWRIENGQYTGRLVTHGF